MKDVQMNSFQATSFPFASTDLTKPWAGFKLPAFKLDTLLEAHRKNADALTNANHVVFDGLNRMAQCQGELFTTTVNDFSRVTRDVVAGASFGEKSTNQVDAVRHIYVSSVAGLRELSDIAVRTNVTAVDILNTRVSEAFDEFRALFAMPAAPAAISAPEVVAEPVTVVEEAPANVAASAKAKPAGSGGAKTAARKAAPAAKPTRRPTARG
jgi:phasin family protein